VCREMDWDTSYPKECHCCRSDSHRTFRYILARFPCGIKAPSPGYSAFVIPILGSSTLSPACWATRSITSLAARRCPYLSAQCPDLIDSGLLPTASVTRAML